VNKIPPFWDELK